MPLVENLTPNRAIHGVADEVHEVGTQHGLAAPDVHVEHLEIDHLVDDVARLGRREFVGIAPTDELRQCTQARLQA